MGLAVGLVAGFILGFVLCHVSWRALLEETLKDLDR